MKWFISQPMKGRTDEEILAEREKAVAAIKNIDPDATILDSFFEKAPHDAKPLWFLGKSFEVLSDADTAYFCKGWNEARGCVMEQIAANNYGISVIYGE